MDTDEISAIIQGLAVIAAAFAIWLQNREQSKQLKQQTELTKIANTQNLVGLAAPFNLELIRDEKMAELWLNGHKDYDGYSDIQKYQYKSLLIWWLLLHENIFHQHQKSLLDNLIYKSWDYDLRFFIITQQLERRWKELKDAFEDSFREHISKLVELRNKGIPIIDHKKE